MSETKIFPDDYIGQPVILSEYDDNNGVVNYHGVYVVGVSDSGIAVKLAPMDPNMRPFHYWMPTSSVRVLDTAIEEEGLWQE